MEPLRAHFQGRSGRAAGERQACDPGEGLQPAQGLHRLASRSGRDPPSATSRLTPLPGAEPPSGQVAQTDEGFHPIFDGASFTGWKYRDEFAGHWVIRHGVLLGTGTRYAKRPADRDIWTEKSYGDFVLVTDWRLPKKPEPKMLPVLHPRWPVCPRKRQEIPEPANPRCGG